MIVRTGWTKPSHVKPFRWWVFHRWCDYEHWHKGMLWDGMRILGFEYRRYM